MWKLHHVAIFGVISTFDGYVPLLLSPDKQEQLGGAISLNRMVGHQSSKNRNRNLVNFCQFRSLGKTK
jgi:hypothetical protein